MSLCDDPWPTPSPASSFVVDARGHRCPVPTLRLSRALERVEVGAVVVLLTDDPMARIDAPHLIAAQNHQLLAIEQRDGALRFTIRKGAPQSEDDPARS